MQPVKSPANTFLNKQTYLTKKLLTKHFLDYSKLALPGDYLEKEDEDDDDDEKNTNVEQSPGKNIRETIKMKLSCTKYRYCHFSIRCSEFYVKRNSPFYTM